MTDVLDHPEVRAPMMLYLFHRIAAPSHLPGLLLATPSLARDTPPPHPSWRGANHTTVKVSYAAIPLLSVVYGPPLTCT